MVNSEGRKKGLLVVMSLRSGLLETEDAGCSLPPLYNGAVFTGVGRLVGELVRKQGGRACGCKIHCRKSRDWLDLTSGWAKIQLIQ